MFILITIFVDQRAYCYLFQVTLLRLINKNMTETNH